MIQNFDFKRMMMVMRWDLFTYSKTYMQMTLGMTFGITLFYLIQLHSWVDVEAETPIPYLLMMASVSATVGSLFALAMASQIFMIMRSNAQREQFLMLPASNLEKYVARWTFTILTTTVVLAIAYVLSDVVQIVFSYIWSMKYHGSVCVEAMKQMSENFNLFADSKHSAGSVLNMTGLLSLLLMLHAICSLFGTLYRNHALVLTSGSLVVLFMIVGYTANTFLSQNKTLFYNTTTTTEIIAIIGMLVIAVLCYWLSYKVFTRMQAICNKWVNL